MNYVQYKLALFNFYFWKSSFSMRTEIYKSFYREFYVKFSYFEMVVMPIRMKLHSPLKRCRLPFLPKAAMNSESLNTADDGRETGCGF